MRDRNDLRNTSAFDDVDAVRERRFRIFAAILLPMRGGQRWRQDAGCRVAPAGHGFHPLLGGPGDLFSEPRPAFVQVGERHGHGAMNLWHRTVAFRSRDRLAVTRTLRFALLEHQIRSDVGVDLAHQSLVER